MNAFDYVMEALSKEDNEYFNSKNNKAKKIISDYKNLTKSIIAKTKKADAYIKAYPGCDKETHEDGSKNSEYIKAYKYVEDAYKDLDSLSMRIFKLENFPSTKFQDTVRNISIAGMGVVLIAVVLAPFITTFSLILAGTGLVPAVVGGAISDRVDASQFKKWKKKENEWKSVNQENALDKLKEVSSAVEDLDLAFKKKYSPWFD